MKTMMPKLLNHRWFLGVLAAGLALSLLGAPQASAQGRGDKSADKEAKKDEPKGPAEVSADTKIVYQFDLQGEVGRDISTVSMKQGLEDAKRWNPDYLLLRINMSFSIGGRGMADWEATRAISGGYRQLETVRELQTMFTDGIRDDPEWKTRDGKKPELVVWVKNAMGTAAFIPFVAPTIYFTSDAHHGGIGFLELSMAGRGDWVVQEKQYSLRIGRAEGLAIKGGHAPELIRAMSRMDYVLSVSYQGGKPIYYPNDPNSGEELLTDDGDIDAGRRDTVEDTLNFKGNDVLVLDAAKAVKLELAKGIADTQDDLLNELGIARNAVVVKGRHDQIFKNWVREVSKAEEQLNDYWRDFNRIQGGGANKDERNKERAKRLSILRNMVDLHKKYHESINPNNIYRVPEQADLELLMEQLKQQMRLDR